MAKIDGLKDVLAAIERARELDIQVKINTVVMKNINDGEILSLVEYANERGVIPRFLELMSIGPARNLYLDHHFSYIDIVRTIEAEWGKVELVPVAPDSTAMVYRLENGYRFGIIASENKPFCQDCSRLRLSAKGLMFGCLMNEEGFDFRRFLRNPDFDRAEFKELLQRVVATKPIDRIESSANSMNVLGG